MLGKIGRFIIVEQRSQIRNKIYCVNITYIVYYLIIGKPMSGIMAIEIVMVAK